jgi:Protein of unknown function (DUF1566)
MGIIHRTTGIVMSIAVCILMASAISVSAGSLGSPDVPGATSSYTLEDIYKRLNDGTAGTPGVFTEPAPGMAGVMHTLSDIMGKAPVVNNTNGAAITDVMLGKTFWGLTSGAWGPQTGAIATQTLSDTTDAVAAGYYMATTLHAVDADLAAANIKKDVNIFGVVGTAPIPSGTAVAGNVLTGTTFSNTSGTEISGAMVNNAAQVITPGASAVTIPQGYHNGSGSVAGDAGLVTGNIKKGVTIFGVPGKTEVVDTASATALLTDILMGKTAYVGGNLVTGNVTQGGTVPGGDGLKTFNIPDGLYSGTKTATANDAKLLATNIKSGVTIFGATGTTLISSGTAGAANVLTGKTFSNDSSAGISGAMVNVGAQPISPGTSAVTITQGYHNGSGSVAGDADLLAANIKKNVTIFNVAGTYSGSAGSVSVPKTGQTTTVPLDPAPAGSDGALQYGVAWPTQRFTNNNNGTVTDNLTGLIWLQRISCLEQASWEQSLTLCYNLASSHVLCILNDGSKAGDWRMPNISELESVRAVNYTYPALSNDAGTGKWVSGSADSSFTYVKTTYWSSTSVASDTTLAWNMNMGTGVMGSTSKLSAGTVDWLYVWPVRGGQK